MDPVLLAKVSEVTPKMNRSVATGLAVEHMMEPNPDTGQLNMLTYVDELFSVNSIMFPEGLTYEGSAICPPTKQFEELTREYESKRHANVARNDTILVQLNFALHGKPLYPKYVELPFVRKGGLLRLNGTLYNIAPVLADIGFSVSAGAIYIGFRRTKLTFKRQVHHYLVNGRRQIIYAVWANIHQNKSDLKKRSIQNRANIESTLAHYFFARFGFTQTLKQWAGADAKFVFKGQLNQKDYPRKTYTIYESLNLQNHPAGELCVVVKKEHDTQFVRDLIGGFFYIVDTFPEQFMEIEYIDEPLHWRRLLGRVIFGDLIHEGLMLENIDTHMNSFEVSLDAMTRDELRERDLDIENIWDLCKLILTDLSVHFYQTDQVESSMDGKRFSVLNYVLADLNKAISMFCYGFQSYKNRVYTEDELNDILRRHIKLKTAVKSLTKKHGEINVVTYPGCNLIFQITAMLIPQDRARSRTGRKSAGVDDGPNRRLHSTIAAVGQYANHPKTSPDGRSRVNPTVETKANGLIVISDEKRKLLDKIQKRIQR